MNTPHPTRLSTDAIMNMWSKKTLEGYLIRLWLTYFKNYNTVGIRSGYACVAVL
jgi:hypothetical protein